MFNLMSPPVHILVVDDNPQQQLAAEALLAHPGAAMLTAASGRQALELLQQHEVALALIGTQLPDMSGAELAQRIRTGGQLRRVPLIYFSGADARLARQLQELKHALELNEKFTAVLGHDLRTPLSVVMNGAMLLPMMTDSQKVAVTAQRIQSSAKRMGQMVDQLLDLARISSGAVALARAEHDLAALCRRLCEDLEPAGKARRITLDSHGDMLAHVDPAVFTQALRHLLGNALLHGEQEHLVRLQLDGSAQDAIELRVSNRGAIAQERLPHLFEPFQHGAEARKAGQGLGLGLYTASKFIQAHGGRIAAAADSTHGNTVFTVTLPRAAAAAVS
jgi:signal transduction histidine kinase